MLIIDDASTDSTSQVGPKLAANDRRVVYRGHATNHGHIATYNEGLLEWASAKYALLLSADDMLAPGALGRATRLMNEHPDVGMTYGMARYIWDDEDPGVITENATTEYKVIPGAQFLRRCFEHGNSVATPTAIVRTDVQREIAGYSSDFPHAADMEMWMRFGARGAVGVLRAVQAYYRWHGRNMSGPYRAEQIRDKREVAKVCRRMADEAQGKYPESNSWLELTYKRLGEEAFWLASTAWDAGDHETCRIYLEHAIDFYPDIRHSRMWWKLRVKSLFGADCWATVVPFADRLRGLPARTTTHWKPPQRHQQFGWWPDSAT